jgi:hypothetical protein
MALLHISHEIESKGDREMMEKERTWKKEESKKARLFAFF